MINEDYPTIQHMTAKEYLHILQSVQVKKSVAIIT